MKLFEYFKTKRQLRKELMCAEFESDTYKRERDFLQSRVSTLMLDNADMVNRKRCLDMAIDVCRIANCNDVEDVIHTAERIAEYMKGKKNED